MKQSTTQDEQHVAASSKNTTDDSSKDKPVVGNKRSTRGYHPKYEEKSLESLFQATRKRRKTDPKDKTLADKISSDQNSNFAEFSEQAHSTE